MSDWIFAAPLWLTTTIGLAGVVIFVEGQRRPNRPIRNAGIAVFALAVVLLTLARVVDTDKKKVARASQELVRGVTQGKWDTVASLLEPDAVVSVSGGSARIVGADNIISAAKFDTTLWPMNGTWVDSMQLDQTPSDITATMTLRSTLQAYPMPVPSTVQIDWVKDNAAWKVQEVRVMQIADKTGSDMERELFHK